MLNFTATVKLAESSEGSISQAGVFGSPVLQPRGLPKESLYMEAHNSYCLLYIIYLVLIYNCLIARGSFSTIGTEMCCPVLNKECSSCHK